MPRNTYEDPPDWTPPDYAIPADSEEWTPPDYATTVDKPKQAKPEPNIFSRAVTGEIEALKATKDFLASKIKKPTTEFGKGLIDVPKSMYESVNKTGKTAAEQINKGDYPGAFHSIFGMFTDPLEKPAEIAVRHANPFANNEKEAKDTAAENILGLVGLPYDELKKAIDEKNYPRLAGQATSAAATALLFHKLGSKELNSDAGINPPADRAGRSGDELAIRRPKDYVNKSSEVPLRFQGELPAVETQATPVEVPIKKPFVNPFEKKVKTPIDESKVNLPPDLIAVGEEDFFNKAVSDNKPKSTEDILYEAAKRKFNMGQEIPTDEIKPTAEFKGWQLDDTHPEGGFPLYDIKGGPSDKSSVGVETLNKMGIEVPETPPKPQPMAGLNEWKAPEYANLVEPELVETSKEMRARHAQEVEDLFKTDLKENDWEKAQQDMRDRHKAELATLVGDKKNVTPDKTDVIDAEVVKPEKVITIDNAPPNLRARMFRGAHEPVEVLFKDPESRDIFGSGQKAFDQSGNFNTNIMDRYRTKSENVAKTYNISDKEARQHITDYNAEIRRLGKNIDKNGGDFTAPSFKEFVESKQHPALEDVELHGGIGSIGSKGKKYLKSTGPTGPVLDKLFQTLGETRENLVQQDIINKQERARRFASFADVKEGGSAGAAKSLSKLRGEFDKVEPGKALGMTPEETDSLFTAIKKSRKITNAEKARGYTALFKLMNGEANPVRSELRVLDDVFGNGFSDRITELHGGLGAVGLKAAKTANTMKALSSSFDFSAPLRQGLGLIHKPEYREALGEMFKYFKDKDHYNAFMQGIEEHPDYMFGRESGLFLSKSNDLMKSEEAFGNNYIGDIPRATGIPQIEAASERAYTGFLNNLRFNVFNNLIKQAKLAGHEPFVIKDGVKIPTKIAENLAHYVNVSTGRGGLGPLEKIAPELNAVLWSPRFISSRLSILNPKYYMDADPFTRKEAIKSLFAIAAASTAMVQLGKLAGGKTNNDPTSSDYHKVRFGTHVLDPNGGFQQPIVAASRMIAELNRMGHGRKRAFNQPNILDIGTNFLRSKESPMANLIDSLATTNKITGDKTPGKLFPPTLPQAGGYTDRYNQKKYMTTEIRNKFTPMFIQDFSSLLESDPTFAEAVGLGGADLLGAGLQEYPEKKPASPLSGFGKLSLR